MSANVLEVTTENQGAIAKKFGRAVERWGLPLEVVKDSPLSAEDEILALCDSQSFQCFIKCWNEVPVYTSLRDCYYLLETVSRAHTVILDMWGRWYVFTESGMQYFIAQLRKPV